MINKIKNLFTEENGQGMTEYGLVLGVVGIGAIVALVALVALRDQITSLIQSVKSNIFDNTPTTTS